MGFLDEDLSDEPVVYEPVQVEPVVVPSPMPEPSVVQSRSSAVSSASGRTSNSQPILVFLLVLFALLWFRCCVWPMIWDVRPGPGPGPGPDPSPVSGEYAVLLYDDDDKDEYSAIELAALDSVEVASYLKDHADAWLKLDVDQIDELENVAPPLKELASQHYTDLPWVVASGGGRMISEKIESKERLLSNLQKVIK